MRSTLACALFFLIPAKSAAASPPAAPPAAQPVRPAPESYRSGFDAISEADLRAWLGFLAADELEGRESGTKGYDVAARYVASVLESLGVAPLGDGGTYFQAFDLVRRERNLEEGFLSIRTASGVEERASLAGQMAVRAVPGEIPAAIDWEQPWVCAGRGESAAEDAVDDFHGLDVAQSVVLVLPRPGRTESEDRGARLAGAQRIVVVSDKKVADGVGIRFRERAEACPDGSSEPTAAATGPSTVYVSRKLADQVLKARGSSLAEIESSERPQPFRLDGVQLHLKIPVRETRRTTRNVAGILQGSDPVLRGECVAVGSHLDHVGTQNGTVFPGADDDASGVSAVLGVAKAFAKNPTRPRRSLVFLFFAAEEKGLFGSQWYVDHPPVALASMALELQMDMVGRNEERGAPGEPNAETPADNEDTLHVVGSKRHSLELDPWVTSINDFVGLRFEYDEERVYSRSDQYNFGSRGVPVVFFFSGFHPDYHQPTDTPKKINFRKLGLVTRLVFALGFEVADRPARLRIHRV